MSLDDVDCGVVADCLRLGLMRAIVERDHRSKMELSYHSLDLDLVSTATIGRYSQSRRDAIIERAVVKGLLLFDLQIYRSVIGVAGPATTFPRGTLLPAIQSTAGLEHTTPFP